MEADGDTGDKNKNYSVTIDIATKPEQSNGKNQNNNEVNRSSKGFLGTFKNIFKF